jgi:hypothetical protein
MSTLSVREALAIALDEMETLSAAELRADLEKHKDGPLAVAMRTAREFLSHWTLSRGYFFIHAHFAFKSDKEQYTESKSHSPDSFEYVTLAVNDNSYALAA